MDIIRDKARLRLKVEKKDGGAILPTVRDIHPITRIVTFPYFFAGSSRAQFSAV